MGIHEIKPGSPAVFLDRDGIINRAIVRDGYPYPPSCVEDLELLPGIIASAKALVAAGYVLIGITNQPDVARGTQSREGVQSINVYIQAHLPIRAMMVCYHDDLDHCECRKPKPGLIIQAAREFALDLSRSWMVGDRWKDIAAGQAAGLKTIFMDNHYSERYQGSPATYTIEDAMSIVQIILKGSK